MSTGNRDEEHQQHNNKLQIPPATTTNTTGGGGELVQRARTVEGEIEHVQPTTARTTLMAGNGKMVFEATLNRLSFTHRYKPHRNFAQIIQELEAGRGMPGGEEGWPNRAAYEATTNYHAGLTTSDSAYMELHDFTDGMQLFVAAGQGARFKVTIEQLD